MQMLWKCIYWGISLVHNNNNSDPGSKHLEIDDVNHLNLLTLSFILKHPTHITNERFYLCLELLSQGLMYCDSYISQFLFRYKLYLF